LVTSSGSFRVFMGEPKGRCPLTPQGSSLDYHIKCNTAPKKERHCVRFVLE
jgi:hypothetical protein